MINRKLFASIILFGTATTLTGCGITPGGGRGGNDSDVDEYGRTEVTIEVLKGGLGETVYRELAKAYNDAHPDVSLSITLNRTINDTVDLSLQQGKNVADAYCIRDINKIKRFYSQGYIKDLTDVFNSEIENGETLLDKMDVSAASYSDYNGKYICIPEYVNANGFVYNKDMFDRYHWEIPTTTEQFQVLLDKILADTGGEVKPIVFTRDAQGYVYYLLNGINTSYNGIANMDRIVEFENSEIFNPTNCTGKKAALTCMQNWMLEENGYVLKGSIGMSNNDAIKNLMDGKAAMMLNGSWFETEPAAVSSRNKPNLGIMKVPEYSVGGTIKRAEGYTSEEGKGLIHSEYTANFIVPEKAKHADIAIDFLKFISTNAMCELYTKCCNSIRPFNYNKDSTLDTYKDMSTFGKSVLDMAKNNTLYVPVSHNPRAIAGEISLWPMNDADSYHVNRLLKQSYTPDQCLQLEYQMAKSILG